MKRVKYSQKLFQQKKCVLPCNICCIYT